MKPSTVWSLAIVLTKSQLRSYQRSKLAKWFGNPNVIFILDALLVGILGTIGYYLISNLPQELLTTAGRLEVEVLIGIPTITTFVIILFGILTELSQPIQSTSADLVNWLPITPSEYVLGSTLSLSYTYSFLLAFFLGLALGPALYFAHGLILAVSAIMGIIALFIGSSAVELIRAVTNRISSSFYRKSGRSGIFARLGLTIIALVVFQLLFSGRVIASLLGHLTQTVATEWYIPVIWPSLVVQTLSVAANSAPVVFGLLSLGFMLTVFALAVGMRRAFWVPVPVSIRLSTQPYHTSFSGFRIPGLDVAESAIIRKDFRSLTRRREMARFLAIPFVLAASLWVSMYPFGGSSDGFGIAETIPLYVIPIAIFCEVLSMTSIGQEGSAIWNLYAAPLDARKLVRAKMYLTLILGSLFTCGLLLAITFLSNGGMTEIASLLFLGIIVVLEESALGVYVAGRFPDFRETVRSRYVSISGSLLGPFFGLVVALLTASPLLIADVLPTMFPPIMMVMLIGLLIFAALWKLAIRQVEGLLAEIQV